MNNVKGDGISQGGAEAHCGPMTHLFAGFSQQGGGEHNSVSRRMPMIISRSNTVRSLLSKVFESHWPFANRAVGTHPLLHCKEV